MLETGWKIAEEYENDPVPSDSNKTKKTRQAQQKSVKRRPEHHLPFVVLTFPTRSRKRKILSFGMSHLTMAKHPTDKTRK